MKCSPERNIVKWYYEQFSFPTPTGKIFASDSLDLECSRGPGKMAATQFKNFLYAFCGKRKVRPIYTERPSTQGTFKFQVMLLFIENSS